MIAIQLIANLESRGISIKLSSDRLICSPKEKLTDELRESIRQNKSDLIAILRDPFAWWHQLADSGLSHADVIPLEEAIFLFAFRRVQETKGEVWGEYSQFWRERLPAEAFAVLADEFKSVVA